MKTETTRTKLRVGTHGKEEEIVTTTEHTVKTEKVSRKRSWRDHFLATDFRSDSD